MRENKFVTEQKSSKLLLEIITLVSSTNNNGSGIEFILRGRSFTYIMNNRGPRIDPWGTPCFNVPQRKNFGQIRRFYFNLLSTIS